MSIITQFIVCTFCFVSLPCMIAIVFHLYRLREPEDDLVKISFVGWTLTNPFGVVAIPIFTYFVCIFWGINWDYTRFTEISISTTLYLPTIFAGILAVGSTQYKTTTDLTKMNIVQEVKKDSKEIIKVFKEEFKRELTATETRHEARLTEQRAYYEGQLKAQQAQAQAQADAQAREHLEAMARIDKNHQEAMETTWGTNQKSQKSRLIA